MHPEKFDTQKIYQATVITVAITIVGGLLLGDVSAGFDEGGLGTIVSVVFLAITSFASFRIYKLRKAAVTRESHGQHRIWAIIAAGFAFLACDDAFEIHENLDKLIHEIAGMKETPLTDRIDDVLILVYGLIGVFLLYSFKGEILRIPEFVALLKRGFGFMLLQFAIDAFINGQDYIDWFKVPENYAPTVVAWGRTIEETVKLLAVATLLAAMTHALRFVIEADPSQGSSSGKRGNSTSL